MLRHVVQPSSIQPLQVRPGARFACTGGGLCCSEVHAIGPVTTGEIAALEALRPGATRWHERVRLVVLATKGERCVFLRRGLCSLHTEHPEAKPSVCRRFPFGIVATPAGGRIFTLHRCACRSLGERAPIDPGEVTRWLAGDGGALSVTARVEPRITLAGRTRMSFEAYARAEAVAIDRLANGEDPASVFGTPPAWPAAQDLPWATVGETFRRAEGAGTRFDAALAWFGAGIQLALDLPLGDAPPPRPWARDFDAHARRAAPRDPAQVLGDWAADLLWDLRWSVTGSLARLATDLKVRHAVARSLTARWTSEGARPDRAAAEALLVVELGGETALWGAALGRLDHPRPSLRAEEATPGLRAPYGEGARRAVRRRRAPLDEPLDEPLEEKRDDPPADRVAITPPRGERRRRRSAD